MYLPNKWLDSLKPREENRLIYISFYRLWTSKILSFRNYYQRSGIFFPCKLICLHVSKNFRLIWTFVENVNICLVSFLGSSIIIFCQRYRNCVRNIRCYCYLLHYLCVHFRWQILIENFHLEETREFRRMLWTFDTTTEQPRCMFLTPKSNISCHRTYRFCPGQS